MTSRRTRNAAYAVALDGPAVLLARIASGYPGAGRWTLPGGGVEWGEHPHDALIREVYEETGLTVAEAALADVDARVYPQSDTRPALHVIRLIYDAHVAGNPHVTEIDGSVDAAAWVPLADLPDLPTVELVARGLAIVHGRTV